MPVPSMVQLIVDAFLDAIDAEVPGLIEGLYLVGSVALGEFRPDRSDIDFVAVTATRPDAAALAALAQIHRRLQERWPRPFFDGIYVTWDDLAGEPARAGLCADAHEGHLNSNASGDLIAWHILARHGVCVRGPAVAEVPIWTDAETLAAWT